MKNILLINPWNPEVFCTPAIGYLQSYLLKNNTDINVIAIDEVNLNLTILPSYIDFIGISFHSFSVSHAHQLMHKLKQKYPDAKYIAGGHHSSALPGQMISLGFDYVIVGPGEIALSNLISGTHTSSNIIDGELPLNLDDIPSPNYAGLASVGQLFDYVGKTVAAIISSRGCPFSCNFCASSNFWQHKWYPHSPEYVIADILHKVEVNKITAFMFEDDNFLTNKDRAMKICELLITQVKPKYPYIVWQMACRAEALNDIEVCKILVRAGCTHIWLGLESGSEKILNMCNKNTDTTRMLNGIATAAAAGIRTNGQFIVGLIGENDSTIQETVNFIRKSKLTMPMTNIAWVLPNTDLHSAALKCGFSNDSYLTGVEFFTYENSISTLNNWNSILHSTQSNSI